MSKRTLTNTTKKQPVSLLMLGNLSYLQEMAKKYGNDCSIGYIVKQEKEINKKGAQTR